MCSALMVKKPNSFHLCWLVPYCNSKYISFRYRTFLLCLISYYGLCAESKIAQHIFCPSQLNLGLSIRWVAPLALHTFTWKRKLAVLPPLPLAVFLLEEESLFLLVLCSRLEIEQCHDKKCWSSQNSLCQMNSSLKLWDVKLVLAGIMLDRV